MTARYFLIPTMAWVEPTRKISPHFTIAELADPLDYTCYMNDRFMRYGVELLRVDMAKQFRVNSACRSVATNNRIPGHPRSLHLMYNKAHKYTGGCLALDISTRGWTQQERDKFVDLARKYELSLGHAETFFHIDGRMLIGMPRAEFNYV